MTRAAALAAGSGAILSRCGHPRRAPTQAWLGNDQGPPIRGRRLHLACLWEVLLHSQNVAGRPMQYPIRGRTQQAGESVTAMGADDDQVSPLPFGDTQDFYFGPP